MAHGIGGAAANRTRTIVVGITIVVDIAERRRAGGIRYRKHPHFFSITLLFDFRQPRRSFISNSIASTYGRNFET